MNEKSPTTEKHKVVRTKEAKEALLRKIHRVELGFGLFLFALAIAPIVLYYCDTFNIYNVMLHNEVAAYATAIYVAVVLVFKLINDSMREKNQYDLIFYRDNKKSVDYRSPHAYLLHTETEQQLLEVRISYSKARMVRYLAVWVSYMFVSLSHSYVRNIVGGQP